MNSEFEQKILCHKFKNKNILKQALTHPSVPSRNFQENYERLEFFGDSVLGFLVSKFLYNNFKTEREGDLAKRKAALVCGKTLSKVAQKINLGEHLIISVGEETNGGRLNQANLENALEAVVAALYLDGGIDVAENFITKHLLPLSKEMISPPKDPKTELQEWAQGRKLSIPLYETVLQEGTSHAPIFTVKVSVEGQNSASANGKSKKIAERNAAEKMLNTLEPV